MGRPRLGVGRGVRRVVASLGPAVDAASAAPEEHGLFGRIVAAWSDAGPEDRRRGAALDVVQVHVASMSNLNAALGWALVDLLVHPDALELVRGGDAAFASRCALESTRLAQRSIMSRHVMSPVALDTGATTYEVGPGVTIATLLPLALAAKDYTIKLHRPAQVGEKIRVELSGRIHSKQPVDPKLPELENRMGMTMEIRDQRNGGILRRSVRIETHAKIEPLKPGR